MTALRKAQMTVSEFLPGRDSSRNAGNCSIACQSRCRQSVSYMATPNIVQRELLTMRSQKRGCRADLFSTAPWSASMPETVTSPMFWSIAARPIAGDALEVPNPVVVVEVLSPGNALADLRDKLQGYFRVASIHHYLIIDPDKRLVIHHTRGHDDVVGDADRHDGPNRTRSARTFHDHRRFLCSHTSVEPQNAARTQPQNDRGAMPRRHAQGLRRHPRLPCAGGAAHHLSPSGAAHRHQAAARARREGRRLHGGRLCARLRQAGHLHGAGDRRAQPRCRPARRLPRPFPGHRHDRRAPRRRQNSAKSIRRSTTCRRSSR